MSDSNDKKPEETVDSEAVIEQVESTEDSQLEQAGDVGEVDSVDQSVDEAIQDVLDSENIDASDSPDEDEHEQSSIEAMTEIALDSAEAANHAAESANASAELIIGSVAAFNESMAGVQKKQNIMFWVFAGLLIVSASVSGVLLERFTQSAVQADEIMLTVGKRVVQMDTDVKRMAKLREELNGLNETNIVLNMQVTEALNNMRDYEKQAQVREESGIKRTQEILDRISNRLDVKFDKFAETVTSLEDKVKHNAIRLEKVGDELSELTISVNEMKDQQLVEKLDALIKLEQHRYYDMMSKSSNDKDLKKDDVEAVCVPRLGFPCP
jgi:hypothetical protein